MPRHALPSLLLLAALAACERTPPAPPPIDPTPPDGRAHYTADDGTERTLLRPVGTLRYGERVVDPLPAAEAALLGYEFAGSAGDTPTLILDVAGDPVASLALYGDRDDTGLWGRPLAAVHGAGVLRIADVELPRDGHYFVLVRRLAGPPADYALELRCDACAEPACPEVEPCDLYCEQGYGFAEDGCRICACEENPCDADSDCLESEICRDGICRPAPSCEAQCADEPLDRVCDAEGRTHPNRCVAECLGVGEVRPGPCEAEQCSPERPCPDGQRCVGGRCLCDCPPDIAPVCAESGDTYSNLCELECHGAALAHEGPCDARPPQSACEDSDDCRPGLVCARGVDGPGLCSQPCRPNDPRACGPRAHCTPLAEGRGACLPLCRGDAFCPASTACLPDREGVPVCLPCDCPEEDAPVCGGGVDFASRCTALCAGVPLERLEPGPCAVEPAPLCRDCPVEWAPVCGDGELRATLCDAECGARPALRVSEPMLCIGRVPMACEVDADCLITGAEETLCAAERTAAAPRVGPEVRCFADFGACGCNGGICGFRPPERPESPEAAGLAMCLERARASRE